MPENEGATESLRNLLCLLAEEHPVFQSHVLDLVRDAIQESGTLAERMAQLHASFPPQELEAFIAALPPAHGSFPRPRPVGELLALVQHLPDCKIPPADIAALTAGELLHRLAWNAVMARNPGTLVALKERLLS